MNSVSTPLGIKQLAKSLGISIGTVSRALNNRYGVNPRTRARVLEEARRLGYVPNSAARRLKDHPALTIGLFFAPFVGLNQEINPAALNFVQMLKNQAELEGYSLDTIFFSRENEMRAQVESHRFDVAVFYGQFPAEVFDVVNEIGVPAVVLHHHARHADQVSICIDMKQAAATAVEYLAALGHERIGIVTGPAVSLHVEGYRAGFLSALEEFGLTHVPEWDWELAAADSNKTGAAEALLPLFRSKRRPTAMIFFSDWLALGGRQAARNAKLRVPEDISLIGFENMPSSAEIDPPLTTFDVHFPKAAELVIEMATKLGGGQYSEAKPEDREILMSAELVKRGSCACLRKLVR